MSIGQIWLNANPDLSDHLRRANEARAAAYYAAFKAVAEAVAKPIRHLAERLRRARRARQTYHALAGLSDHNLRDIGLSRSEVHSIAHGIAELPDGTDATLAELRGIRREVPAGDDVPSARRPAAEARRVRVAAREAAPKTVRAARLAG
jgi:uncharacterized protein YjiS (DUF1127 family)